MAAYKELADKYPSASRGARGAVHGGAHRGEHRLLRQGGGAVRAAGQKYPQNPHAADALRSAGVLRQSLGQHDKAIKHYGEYAQALQGQARRQGGRVPGRPSCARSRRTGAAPPQRSPTTRRPTRAMPRTVEALAREADAYLKAGNDAERQGRGRQGAGRRSTAAASTHGKAADERGEDANYYAAAGALHPGRARLPRLRAPQDRRQAQAAGQGARGEGQALEEAKSIYLDVVTYQSPEWATAGAAAHRPGLRGLRQGDAQRAGAEGPERRREADVPRRAGEGRRRHRGQGASTPTSRATRKALQIGVYNKHTQAIRQALSRLAENEYPKEAEMRAVDAPGRAAHRARPHRRGAP